MNDLLQQGIAAYQSGQQAEARKIFVAVLKQSPDSEPAWEWMRQVCKNDQERIHCLRQLLRINPENVEARKSLDELLAPSLVSEFPLSTVSSVPLSPAASGVKPGGGSSSFTPAQLWVLLGLIASIILISGFALFYLFVVKGNDDVVIAASPTGFIAASANMTPLPTEILPTATLIPTYAYAPTWTPLPSPTSFVITPLVPATPKPQQAQSNPAPAVNPASGNSTSGCSAQLEYAAAMHQYYLDAIDYVHRPMIDYYKSWIDQASRDRDAVGLVEAQRGLENEQAQVQAEKAAENQRYKAEQASIQAGCQ